MLKYLKKLILKIKNLQLLSKIEINILNLIIDIYFN